MNENGIFLIFFGFCLVWISGWVIASILFRRGRRLPILPHVPPNAVFVRRGVSGRSFRDLLSRLGGARNCLTVAVADGRLYVWAMFPFNLMFLPEVYDLEHDIALGDIRAVHLRQGLMGPLVDITFGMAGRPDCRIELRLADAGALVSALGRP